MTIKFDRLTRSRGSGAISDSPEEAVLEPVADDHPDTDYLARFSCPEFTAICPVTGQPGFGHFVIDAVLAPWPPESKSLKLCLHSFRNRGAFHEDCAGAIGKRIVDAIEPKWLRIAGFWCSCGGIPIEVFRRTGAPSNEAWSPDTGVSPYRGRV